MTPRRRPREGVAEQATRQEVGDAPPPQQTQPLPHDAHSGIVPSPPPPPQHLERSSIRSAELDGSTRFANVLESAQLTR
ncbi:hypothetical protein Taro_032355, partial [Colocasia esculenta]|nr:hypothetical protein [Colocasia esculenta]